jgi:hypothetical protein
MHRVLALGIVGCEIRKMPLASSHDRRAKDSAIRRKSAGILKQRHTLGAARKAGRHAGNANWRLCYPMEGALAECRKGVR